MAKKKVILLVYILASLTTTALGSAEWGETRLIASVQELGV
ncbi:MAG: hypothetical protein V7K89_15285 [Nostoc sp.]